MVSSDILEADKKIVETTDWRGTVPVSFGDETLDLPHRLLNEAEITEIKKEIDLQGLQQYKDEEASEEHERLMELQSKDELTDEEREEVQRLSREVDDEGIEDALGEKAHEKIMWAGKQALEPTDEDVSELLATPEKHSRFGIEGNASGEDVRNAIRQHLREMVEDQPYMIKTNVGMQAFMETLRVLGNGLNNET